MKTVKIILEDDDKILAIGDDGNDHIYDKEQKKWRLAKLEEQLDPGNQEHINAVINQVYESFGNPTETMNALLEFLPLVSADEVAADASEVKQKA